ncbi:transmembrane protein, putative (macronuclear) [Tetrahymena thermophila SB210]|uniref:Transmembrane protein, putative n=1 Tax=Tetrahymena thermophila (strain SB210) TaxID=312017 RepID=I7LW50_TETTS|nr:transmembrane protein, putative [Tetrahymena thermophila SB210]EAS00850.3 transmembrane protein, putative [Tetrahymena thermophila SB210]|eukprot:XP_001021095.3 transmembrane protein, putative [Tetrahymena thermophila SB210]
MNDNSINNYQQLLTQRQQDASELGQNNIQEIEMVDQTNNVQNTMNIQYLKQIPLSQENEKIVKSQNNPENIVAEEKVAVKQPLTQTLYICYLVLLIPLCAAITGLADTDQIIYGSIPSYLKGLFIGLLVVTLVNMIYLILVQLYVSRKYIDSIPFKHKLVICGIWFILNSGFFIIGGLSFRGYRYMIDDCNNYYTEIWQREALNLYDSAKSTLCTSSCLCDMKFPFILPQDLQNKITPYINNSQMVVNISQCPGSFQKNDLYYQLKQAENYWGCSGICTPLNLYYFTDINRGTPTEQRPCLQVAIEDHLPQVVNLVKFSSLFTAVVQTIVLLYFLFKTQIENSSLFRQSSNSSDGYNSNKYSSGGSSSSGGQDIDVDDDIDDKQGQNNTQNQSTENDFDNFTLPQRNPNYFAKMFSSRVSKISRGLTKQSTTQTFQQSSKSSVISSNLINQLKKSKLPSEAHQTSKRLSQS